MTTNNDGQNNSLPQRADDRIKKLEEVMNEYSKIHGLTPARQEEIENILSMQYEHIQKLDEETCGEYAVCLAIHSAYIKKEINRQKTKMKYVESNTDIMLGRMIMKYEERGNYRSFEEKKLIAINDNEYLIKLNSHRISAQNRLSELYDMDKHMDFIARTLNDLRQSRRRGNL